MVIFYEKKSNGERLQMWAAVHRKDIDKLKLITSDVGKGTLPKGKIKRTKKEREKKKERTVSK